jgi:hypothetical protein
LGDNVGAFFNGCGKLKKETDRLRSERDASRVRHKSDKGHWKKEKKQMENNWNAERDKTDTDLKQVKTELQVEKDGRARDANDIRNELQENADRAVAEAEG